MGRISKELYQSIQKKFFNAYVNIDREWFKDRDNRFKCRLIIQVLNNRYNQTKDEKYLQAIKMVKRIVKCSKNNQAWQMYLKERELV